MVSGDAEKLTVTQLVERFEVLREVRYTLYTRIRQRRELHIADILPLYLTTKIIFLKGYNFGIKKV
jgi:hypothetical protein